MMKTPYEILEIKDNIDDAGIKKAYLRLVRQYPPERFPDEFQMIYGAYEQIKTEEDRLSYKLFHCTLPEPSYIADLLLQKNTKKVSVSRQEWQGQLDHDLLRFCKDLQLRSL